MLDCIEARPHFVGSIVKVRVGPSLPRSRDAIGIVIADHLMVQNKDQSHPISAGDMYSHATVFYLPQVVGQHYYRLAYMTKYKSLHHQRLSLPDSRCGTEIQPLIEDRRKQIPGNLDYDISQEGRWPASTY